jgi:hypothetical protein
MNALLMSACSVCFGDPNSSLTKGTIAGVVFLLAVIFMVLGGILATGIVWTLRAKKLAAGGEGTS